MANPTLIPAIANMLSNAGYAKESYMPMLNEIRILQNECDDLRGFVDGMREHVGAAAAMYGYKLTT